MSTTPLSSTVLGHFYTKNEKFNFIKTFGILIGFSGILYLFSDNLLIDENNFVSALLILFGSTCYVIGGVLTLKISKKKNENVTGSILIWAIIILIPLVVFIEQPWNITPRLDSTISVIYLGLVSTGIAWLLRFRILVNNGLIFQSQVSYLIPIIGTILGYSSPQKWRCRHIPGFLKRPFLELQDELRGRAGADSRVFGGVEHDSGPFRAQRGRPQTKQI